MRKFLGGLAAVVFVLTLTVPTLAKQPEGLHCPDGWTTKVESEVDGDIDSIVLPAGTDACVKGGQSDPIRFTADGETTLGEYLEGKYNVSYYVVYTEVDPSATPPISPSPSPSVSPSPSTEPTPIPSPSASTTPTPTTEPSSTPPTATPTIPPVTPSPVPTPPATDTE